MLVLFRGKLTASIRLEDDWRAAGRAKVRDVGDPFVVGRGGRKVPLQMVLRPGFVRDPSLSAARAAAAARPRPARPIGVTKRQFFETGWFLKCMQLLGMFVPGRKGTAHNPLLS
jgi:hypothetical protein